MQPAADTPHFFSPPQPPAQGAAKGVRPLFFFSLFFFLAFFLFPPKKPRAQGGVTPNEDARRSLRSERKGPSRARRGDGAAGSERREGSPEDRRSSERSSDCLASGTKAPTALRPAPTHQPHQPHQPHQRALRPAATTPTSGPVTPDRWLPVYSPTTEHLK